METFELFQRFSVALAIGLLIGLERGWQARAEPEGERAAGLRTHALASVLGGVWAVLVAGRGEGGAIALALVFATFSAAVAVFRYREAVHDKTFGVTTVIASMLAFALGALAILGDTAVAGALGVVVAGLLALKPVLHGWIKRLTWEELRSGLLLLAMTFVLLPILPDRTIDPWGAINPYALWLMTVLIAAISFAGYIAIKLTGERHGILFTGIAGGLASSTAVTVTLSKLAAEHPDQRDPLLAGALFSSAVMTARVLVVAGALNAALLPRLVLPIGFVGLVLAGAGFWLLGRTASVADDQGRLALKNPFEFWTVLKFGALLTAITVLAKAAASFSSGAGVYALAAVSGIADVDAITLSMAWLGADDASLSLAATAILIAVGVNTVSKAILGWMTGGPEVGRKLLAVAGLALLAGAAGLALSPRMFV